MKILVVDDHALVREGLSQVLKGLDEAAHILQAPDCARAFDLADQHPDIDLVLLDLNLPDMSGLEALAIFRRNHPELPILVVSGTSHAHTIRQVMAQGAAGFLPKSALSGELLLAIRLVLAGEVVSLPIETKEFRNRSMLMPELGPNGDALTARQLEVLQLLMQGGSNKEIGRVLQLSDETVKNHVSALLHRFGVKTRIQAVIAASELGYAPPRP